MPLLVMNKLLAFIFLLFVSATLHAQLVRDGNKSKPSQKIEKPTIEKYKIISAARDTTYIDTALSIQKDYKHNYLRRDNFELVPFSNVGQTYNSLAYSFDDLNLKPKFVAQSHHFNYLDVEDINYYHVPTPLTELYFKTAFNQGQQLDAFFTVNTTEQFNFSAAYKGLRSLGIYQHSLTSNGNFRFTTNYHTKNERYQIRAHITSQDFTNEENGGLEAASLPLFINDSPDFEDRGRLEVNFEDAENILKGVRYYADHSYQLVRKSDSLSYTVLTLGNSITYEEKFYTYSQDAPFDGFGPSYENSDLNKKVTLEDFNAKAYVDFDNNILGKISGFVGYTEYNYGYNSVLILDDERISNRLKGNIIEAGAAYKKAYRGFELSGKAAVNVSGDFDGNYITGAASYKIDDDNSAEASITLHSVAPNFNYVLYQSDYVNYNWQNNLNNVKTQELKFTLASKKLLDATVSYTGIDDYTYFGLKENDSTPTPQQHKQRVDYLKVKVVKELRYKKFGLANTILFQQALSGEEVFNVPQIVTRNTLFYEDQLFKKALFLQTGINFKYFTAYNMNAYDPVLAEFYVQNNEKIGGFPLVDIFFNAKIRQTRIYLKYEHFNSLFTSKNEYFSAPGYPYRDPVIRFGLVWNFFL